MTLRCLAAVILVGAFAPAFADPAPMRLRDVVTQAVAQNQTLLAAGADVESAEGSVVTQEGLDDFMLDATLGYQAFHGDAVVVPDALNAELDLTKPLATGGSLGVRAIVSRLDSDPTAWSPTLLLVFDQPLLRNAGKRVARAQQRRAKESLGAAELARRATAAVVLRDVVTAYYELAFATADLEVERQAANGAREQLAQVRANITAGKLPPSASAEVEVAVGLRDEEVLLAEQRVLDASLNLRRLAGLPIGAGAAGILAVDGLDSDAPLPELEPSLAAARAASPALLASRAGERVSAIDVEVTDDGLLPQLDFDLKGGLVGVSNELGDATSRAVSGDGWTVTAGLTLHQPLGRSAARGKRAVARAALHRARIDTRDLELQTDEAVVRLVSLAREAKARLDVITPTTKAAQLDLDAERARFEVGRATNFDVLRRQDELAATRLRQARARADYLEAIAALGAATGDILPRLGVVVR